MKYQVIKHNKVGSRQLGLYDTLGAAIRKMTEIGARFNNLSYIGGFPVFLDDKHKHFSIQGSVYLGMSSVVCSINKKELEDAGFCG